jgi:hypothetical protein
MTQNYYWKPQILTQQVTQKCSSAFTTQHAVTTKKVLIMPAFSLTEEHVFGDTFCSTANTYKDKISNHNLLNKNAVEGQGQ